jgi:hypothetical protein
VTRAARCAARGAGTALITLFVLGMGVGAAPATAGGAPAPKSAAAPVRFQLGLNEAVSVPRRRVDALGPEALARALGDDAARAASVGATLVRGHTGAFPRMSRAEWSPRTQAETDAWVRAVQGAKLEAIGMVSPWPGNRTANATVRYLPADLDAYTDWVRRVVERYDGDGVDDMPGLLRPVRYWEVDNEPDLKFTRPPRDAVREVPPGTFCPPSEYAAVLRASAAGIHAASDVARVLGPGLYRPHTAEGEAYLRDVLAVPGAREALDVLTLHDYVEDDGATLSRSLARMRAWGLPLWVTETSVASTRDPDWHARVLVARVARAAEAGAEVLLWHTLVDPPARAGRVRGPGMADHSLFARVADGAEPVAKPAARVFRALAGVLASHDALGAVSDGEGRTRLRDGSVLLWQGRAVAGAGGTDLRTGASVAAGQPVEAPAWLAASTARSR